MKWKYLLVAEFEDGATATEIVRFPSRAWFAVTLMRLLPSGRYKVSNGETVPVQRRT